MLGSVSIITVGKEHHETVLNIPLGLSRCHHGVDHSLCAISEIAELRLPEAERVRVGLCVAVFKTKDSVLTEVTARGNEVSHSAAMRYHAVNRNVATIFVLVENVSVSVREGTTLDILSRDTHMVSFVDKSGESESFSSSPIDTLTSLHRFHAILEDLCNRGVELFTSWKCSYL